VYKSEYDVVYKKLRCRSNNTGSGRILEELEENRVGLHAPPALLKVRARHYCLTDTKTTGERGSEKITNRKNYKCKFCYCCCGI
jgi:hypothetical protein